ncbi:hypothetical protein LSH36_340g06057 [Paralvinella palmiformis]|uniref:Uncharacterized protein n=1 Tax=Paralvinella palmiformis TaxID=53620 RepID=A0AAD9JG82_9ANNE|nr:hypothetical protein LSH36_340g06057 [Paralvinella palmiformis]
MTSVHNAIDKQLYCRVLILIERLQDVDVKDNEGMTILMKCCYLDDVRTARIIAKRTIKYGADINMTDMSGKNALCHAAITNHVTIAKILLRDDDLDLIRKDNDGNTALHLAAKQGHVAIVELISSPLLKYQLPVDVRNGDGMTPLMLACRHGNVETARFLVNKCKASLTMRDNHMFMTARDWLAIGLRLPADLEIFDEVASVDICIKRSLQSKYGDILDQRIRQKTTNILRIEDKKLKQDYKSGNSARSLPKSRISLAEKSKSLSESTRSLSGNYPVNPRNNDIFQQLYTVYSSQTSPSYRTPARPPPLPEPQDKVKHDEARSRRHVSKSTFQKLIRIKRVESIIACWRRAPTTVKNDDLSRKSKHDNPKIEQSSISHQIIIQ